MNLTLDQLKNSFANLSVPQRAELAHYLLESLEDEEEGAAEAWQSLAEQRMREVHAGQITGIPADQVLRSLREPRS